MGGRGAKAGSGGAGGSGVGIGSTGGGLNMQSISNQAPSPQNTPVVPNASTVLSQMTDAQLAQLYNQSRTVDMPNHLNDVADKTQRFVYMAGVNGKPMVLDTASFNQYLVDNNISRIVYNKLGNSEQYKMLLSEFFEDVRANVKCSSCSWRSTLFIPSYR